MASHRVLGVDEDLRDRRGQRCSKLPIARVGPRSSSRTYWAVKREPNGQYLHVPVVMHLR